MGSWSDTPAHPPYDPQRTYEVVAVTKKGGIAAHGNRVKGDKVEAEKQRLLKLKFVTDTVVWP